MSETAPNAAASLSAAAAAAASPGLNWADDVDDELVKPAAAAKNAGNGDDDDAPPGFEHVSPGAAAVADPTDALVAKIGGVAVRREKREKERKS